MIEVYRGSPNTWECDEMGHMNVRFYFSKLMEGLGVFCSKAALNHAFKKNAPSTVQLKDLHIRFLKESHPGNPLSMHAKVMEITESGARIYFQLDHFDGTPSAGFQALIEHIDIHTRLAFPWSPNTISRLKEYHTPDEISVQPRSILPKKSPGKQPLMSDVEQLAPLRIGTGMVQPEHCDIFGNMKPDMFMGRISDSVPNVMATFGDGFSRSKYSQSSEDISIGVAAIEYRFCFYKFPEAGDTFALFACSDDQTKREPKQKPYGLIYWFMDEVSGDAYATAQATLLQFNLETRKAIVPSATAMDMLYNHHGYGLWF